MSNNNEVIDVHNVTDETVLSDGLSIDELDWLEAAYDSHLSHQALDAKERFIKRSEFQQRLHDNFKTTLAQEHLLLATEELVDLIFDRAWESGHASGYVGVENEFINLAEFAQKVINASTDAVL